MLGTAPLRQEGHLAQAAFAKCPCSAEASELQARLEVELSNGRVVSADCKRKQHVRHFISGLFFLRARVEHAWPRWMFPPRSARSQLDIHVYFIFCSVKV
ncbi:unnamed protein product [Polarella glacialis]|uniref:Uncharacterized protein n=1 Tax=Polarella glacialis TaxID=89957 RepID=A0A813LTS8_POLGL|nr:unnamed protein product [Polarella glacialis]CAE8732797.1 unnamed protein product [Polarella glacialis]